MAVAAGFNHDSTSRNTKDGDKPAFDEVRKRHVGIFKEQADTLLLGLQQNLVALETDPHNAALIKEIRRAVHTIKGDAKMLGFGQTSNLAHAIEDVLTELHEGHITLTQDLNDVVLGATDELGKMVGAAANGDETGAAVDVSGLSNELRALIGQTPTDAGDTTGHSIPPAGQIQPVVAQAIPPQPLTPEAAQSRQSNRAASPRSERTGINVSTDKLDGLMNIANELVLSKLESDEILNNLRRLTDLFRSRQRASGLIRTFIGEGRNPYSTDVPLSTELRQALVTVGVIDSQIETLIKENFRLYEEHASHLQNTVAELESSVLSIRMLPLNTLYETLPRAIRDQARDTGREVEPLFIGGDIELDKRVLDGISGPLGHLIRNAISHGIETPAERFAAAKRPAGTLTISATQEGGYVLITVADDGRGIDTDNLRRVAVDKRLRTQTQADALSEEDAMNLIFEPITTARIVDIYAGRGVGMEAVKNDTERLGGQVKVQSTRGRGAAFTLRVPLTLATSRALLVRVGSQILALPTQSIESMFYLSPDKIRVRENREVIEFRNFLLPVVRLEEIVAVESRMSHPVLAQWGAKAHNHSTDSEFLPFATPFASPAPANPALNGYGGAILPLQATLANQTDPLTRRGFATDLRAGYGTGGLVSRTFMTANLDTPPCIIIGSGDKRVCFVVDELVDETEIVVKGLSSLLGDARLVMGATILGNGHIVLILDVPNLLNTARNVGRGAIRDRARAREISQRRILVVDDSITTRELEKSILEATPGFDVELAMDGVEALEKLGSAQYDLVISDIEMPRMNGYELTRAIKADPRIAPIPVIIVSSLASDENKRRGIDAGAQAYITKGDFDQNRLLDTIDYLTGVNALG